MPARQRVCPTCDEWIMTNVGRHMRRCRRKHQREPVKKRRKVDCTNVTKHIIVQKIVTTTTKLLMPGIRSSSQGNTGETKWTPGCPAVLRMLQVGVRQATLEKTLPTHFSELRVEPTVDEQFQELKIQVSETGTSDRDANKSFTENS